MPKRVDVLGVGVSVVDMPLVLATIELGIAQWWPNHACLRDVHGIMARLDDPRVETRTLDIETGARRPSQDDAFDGITMIALIEHLIDPISVMTNIGQMLRPGGFFYLSTPNIAKGTRRIRLTLGQFP